jgi:hypothetical protein
MFYITGINYTTCEVTICPLVQLTSKRGEEMAFLQTDKQLKQVVPKDQLKNLKIGQSVQMSISL